jgi:hypothetical protein
MSRGADGIGVRGGQQVDLRFFANLNGIYDTGLLPIVTDSKGTIADPGALAGVEVQIGAYGVHNWRKAQVGLDYHGDYRHYNQAAYYDGSNQQLQLGYTYQKSRRLAFDLRQMAGTYSNSFGGVYGVTGTDLGSTTNQNGTLLFDNRTTFLESAMDVTYTLSPRNSFSAGGSGYDVMRQSKALVGLHGYTLHGTFEHRLSQRSSIGVTYTHYHYDFPRAFGEATINSYSGGYATTFDRNRWTFKIMGGIMQPETEGLQTINLDPLVASILGVSTTVQTFYTKSTIPSGDVSLSRRFKSASVNFSYTRGITPGNGVYLTSREETAGASVSYSGVRKLSMTLAGNYGSYTSLGQSLGQYRSFGSGYSVTYAMTRALHLVGGVDYRRQDIQTTTFLKNSYRVSFGVAFSPGDIPLSIW